MALSGESADEVFGGYKWFHDPRAQQADTFPWLAMLADAHPGGRAEVLAPEVRDALDLDTFIADSYRQAVSEVPLRDGDSDFERRMRIICYLHLTRFVRILLDRKDRMSMAVGLEVRVPFCDHRLVEYVFNTPWSLKTFDGREKSLLRHAAADVLPKSVVERVKSPYPSTQDPKYAAVLQKQVAQLVSDGDPALALCDQKWIDEAIKQDPAHIDTLARHTFERVLDMSVWFDIHHPTVKL